MTRSQPLPKYLVARFAGWRATDWNSNRAWYERLGREGQRPRAMVVSCCDSRVAPERVLASEPGEIFVHRNIANLVPPCEVDDRHHGTSAAIEYAVTVLRVAHLVVLGHAQCGGVRGCHDMCTGRAGTGGAELFVPRWLNLLRPSWEAVSEIADENERLAAMEREGVRISLANLEGYPFVVDAVAAGRLSLHGAWVDVATGRLMELDEAGEGWREVVPT